MTKIAIYYFERAVTPKMGKPQLLFLCSVCRPMLVNIPVKFRAKYLNGFQVTGSNAFLT